MASLDWASGSVSDTIVWQKMPSAPDRNAAGTDTVNLNSEPLWWAREKGLLDFRI